MSGDKWKDDSIDGYTVSWDEGSGLRSGYTTSTSFSIPVAVMDRALPYTVTVTTDFRISSSSPSASDEGFALDTEPLLWVDGGKSYSISGADRWYVTMLQRGFTYNFDFGAGTGTVEFCPYKSLDRITTPTTTPGFTQSWTCDSDGAGYKYFIRVAPTGASSFTASYAF